MKNENYTIIDAEKAFDKMQNSVTTKTFNKPGLEWIFPNLTKISTKTHSGGESLDALPLRSGTSQRCLLLPL